MQLRYVFSELGQGLRRNVSMHVAVLLTLFVSLTLVGMGVLLSQQASIAERHLGSQLQIVAWLCKDNDNVAACSGEVTDAQRDAIIEEIEKNPEAADWEIESKQVAFNKVKELYDDGRFDGPNSPLKAEDMRESIWITLEDPREFEGIRSAILGLDGVSSVTDHRENLKQLYGALDALRYGSWAIATFLGVAALLLVANTIRLAALARRKEIQIMRLVGASTLYIALPFLLEAFLAAVVGAGMAAGALAGFMYFGIEQRISTAVGFMPWIGLSDYLVAILVVGVLGPLLTMVPTLLLTRKYLRV